MELLCDFAIFSSSFYNKRWHGGHFFEQFSGLVHVSELFEVKELYGRSISFSKAVGNSSKTGRNWSFNNQFLFAIFQAFWVLSFNFTCGGGIYKVGGNPRGPPEIISWQCLAVCIDLNRKFSSWQWQFSLRYCKKLIIAKFILIFLFTF